MKRVVLMFFASIYCILLSAGEGMWLPLFLKSLNEADMKSMGMKISADDIYSINKGSLKDAIVHFGGGCTSEIISGSGLLLTNHHCGYGYIQSHSSVQNNLLRNGFWAKNKTEELPCEGLSATIIVRIEDVTTAALANVNQEMSEVERKNQIDKNVSQITKTINKLSDQEVFVRAFYNGNQFFAFVTEVYADVRLVGTPPESIGKFGADTDNWVWPRHTGDFSLFRIYAGKNNRPSKFDPDNRPYVPKHFLPIAMNGVEEGDFTMVFGFPGRTNEYLVHEGVRQTVEAINPVRIKLRTEALSIMDKHMRADEAVKIKYAGQYASIANAWKKWIGEVQGIQFTKALEKKKAADADFNMRVARNEKYSNYRQLVSDLESNYRSYEPWIVARELYAETFQRNIQAYNFFYAVERLHNNYEGRGEEVFNKMKMETLEGIDGLFENYVAAIDQEVMTGLLNICMQDLSPAFVFPYLRDELKKSGSVQMFVSDLYAQSKFLQSDKLKLLLKLNYPEWKNEVTADPLWKLFKEMDYFIVNDLVKSSGEYEDRILVLRRKHMKALMEIYPDRKFYPDANSTLRVSYGQVEGFSPRDGVWYKSKTYLDGVLEKYKPGDYEFDVHPKLLELYKKKDYGVYGDNGKMPLAFIGSNHTTGGNSGSPAIDAYGNLIGLNFDRVWEGTMSDINYDRRICRNIMVDVRYILFVVDKFAGAGHLVEEMKLVYPKKKARKKSKAGLVCCE